LLNHAYVQSCPLRKGKKSTYAWAISCAAVLARSVNLNSSIDILVLPVVHIDFTIAIPET